MRVLVAEDDEGLREVLVLGLADAGYQVDAVERGDDAIDYLKWYEYDVAVIDWRMPGAEGIDVVAWARRNDRPTALLMLTARDTPADRIRGLDTGADDYLVKPFDFGELLARVRALQRRPRGVDAPVLSAGRLELDPVTRVVTVDGAERAVTSTEYRILELLLRRSPAVVDRKAIAEHAWQDETEPLGSNAIDVQMSRLRAKLPDAGVRIVTVRGAGYRLDSRMTMSHVPAVRRESIRVALSATIVVALAYLVVAAGVIAFATVDLTRQIDDRITGSFNRLPPDGARPPDQPFEPEQDPERPLAARTLVWTVLPDGSVLATASTPNLPADLASVTTPVTATIDGTSVRVAGTQVGDVRVVAAESLEFVADAQRTIILGTLLIAPFLLGSVFVGAVIVGRRVAEPIEAARRRQLEFTADASHELRTPLSVIEAHTSLALAQERDTSWYRSAFGRIDRESKRMRHLLEDMLWLARFDAAQAPRATEPVDLGVLASQAADRFAAVAETRHLALSVAAPSEAVVITASAELVDRLIGVLVDNACKYSPEGGRVGVTVSGEAGRAIVSVDDSGPGIRDEDRDRIFDRFHRSVATSSEAGGAGLGLAIGDAIVRATGGRWSVAASPLGGARFAVSWPRGSLG